MKIRSLLTLLLCLALALGAAACADTTDTASSQGGSRASASSAASDAVSETGESAGAVSDVVSDVVSEASQAASSVAEIPKDYSRRTVLLTSDPSLWRITGRTYEVNAADGRKSMCFDMGGMGFHFTADCEGDVSLQISMRTSANNDGKNYQHFLVRVDGEGTDVTVDGSTSEAVRTLPL